MAEDSRRDLHQEASAVKGGGVLKSTARWTRRLRGAWGENKLPNTAERRRQVEKIRKGVRKTQKVMNVTIREQLCCGKKSQAKQDE